LRRCHHKERIEIRYAWGVLRSTLCAAVIATTAASVSRVHAEVFEEVLTEILGEREAPSGVEKVVEKMLAKREEKAARYLDVWQCMSIALDRNKEIREAWHLLQQTQVGDRMIARSRLFPQLEFIVSHSEADYDTDALGVPGGTEYDDTGSSLKLSQRILEYGKDASTEVALRASQRSALYNFESTVRRVLTQVRETFYVILLRNEQIRERLKQLERFREDWKDKKTRFEEREIERRPGESWREPSIDPKDVLEAETNVLNELGRINRLIRLQANLKVGLLQLMGESIGQNVEIVGTQDATIFEVEEAVRLALKNSIEVARLEEEMDEQERRLRQLWWEFAPDVSLQTGLSQRDEDVALNLSNVNDTWAVDVSGETFFDPGDERKDRFESDSSEDFFLNMEMRLPILEGFARVGKIRRERERLKQAEARIQRAAELAELDVRTSYESLLEGAMGVQLQAQQVAVSRRVFEMSDELRERIPARVPDYQYEQNRNRFFADQDQLFEAQARFISVREELREAMGYFE
jgi:outer membrane protein TolC